MGIVAYTPLLHLIDSQVAVYKIYVLKNPFNDEVFYVGQTLQDLETRLGGHISESASNKPKWEYIQNIIKNGSKPLIQAVEIIKGTCYIDKMALNEREKYWIRYYKSSGSKLLNVLGTRDNDKCHEYHSYLSSLKNGEAKWHYYYCGKTIRGASVYDEKRLNDDGFQFPQERLTEPYFPESYNPWDNERFIKKIGYRKSYDDPYSYVPCYTDTDPNFYDEDY